MGTLFDTNILIDHLAGVDGAQAEIAAVAPGERHISRITWLEVLRGAKPGPQDEAMLRGYLGAFRLVELDAAVSERAQALANPHTQSRKLKLPDAIILAAARERGLVLVTRNTRDFPAGTANVRHPAY